MKTSPDTSGAAGLEERLKRSQQLAEAGTYREALAAVREAKHLQPNSVYVLALEKQIEQLIELTDAKIITDDQRTDILESIPGIIERALQGTAPSPKPAPSAPPVGGRDREAALEWLKNQYFQHAHDFVKRGEYENALAEIRRVFIIDPGNGTAKDFEQQIEELAQVRRSHISAASVPPSAPSGAVAPEAKGVPQHRHVVSPATAGAEQKQKKHTARTILLFVLLAVVAVITVYVIMKLQPSEPKPSTPTVISPSQEIFQEAGQDTARFVVPQTDTLTGSSGRGPRSR